MTNLLISTPKFLLRHNLESGRTFVVENSRPEYYGISWFQGGKNIVLSYSGVDNASLVDLQAYAHSEVGWLSHGRHASWPFLSQPHQLLCIEDRHIAVTNTGRNCVTIVDRGNWSIRNVRFNDILWDRLDRERPVGSHFNSLDYRNGRLCVLAHNFGKNSFMEEIDWPTLKRVRSINFEATELHNLWVREDGRILSCDSMRGSLIELTSGEILWSANKANCLVRGMACMKDALFVGASDCAPAEDRSFSHGGIWVLHPRTWETRDYIALGRVGAIHEIRILDAPDFCHPNGTLRLTSELEGAELSELL